MKTKLSIIITLLFSVNLFSQIEVLQIEKHSKTLDLIVPIPNVSQHAPTGLVYQDTSGNAFTNLSDRMLRIADAPFGFQVQNNPVIYSEVTKNNFSINHYYPYDPNVINIGPDRRGNWGPRNVANPFYYDFNTFGNIYNVDYFNRKLSELASYNGAGALNIYRYEGGSTYKHTLTINDSGNPVWFAVGDISIIDNIVSVKSILPQVIQLEMKEYKYKDLDKTTRGYIAQEVQKIFPEMVTESEEGLLSVDHLGFGALAIQAIKEQQDIITSLEERMEKIERLLEEK